MTNTKNILNRLQKLEEKTHLQIRLKNQLIGQQLENFSEKELTMYYQALLKFHRKPNWLEKEEAIESVRKLSQSEISQTYHSLYC